MTAAAEERFSRLWLWRSLWPRTRHAAVARARAPPRSLTTGLAPLAPLFGVGGLGGDLGLGPCRTD